MIVGSGWPFGGEFLPREQQLQMMTLETVDIDAGSGGTKFSITEKEILDRTRPGIASPNPNPLKELVSLRLMPKKVDVFTEGVYYDNLVGNQTITIDVPAGKHVLYCFVKMTGFMNVIEGAPGGRGPVLNHFDSTAVNAFLDRTSTRMGLNGKKLKGKVHAAFTDSFELEGGNWSDHMLDEFEKRFGYSLVPYLPYIIFKVGHMGNPISEEYGSEFSDEVTKNIVQRVRNDFEHLQIEVFHDNYLVPFNEWCHRNGMLSRVQAYGRACHPIESSMYIDIPECETWFMGGIGKEFKDRDYWRGRSHSMINKFVASGSFLAGNGLVSCEEITNTGEVFHTTLEEIKIAGDLSNLSGVNHSILHGYNYSPKDAPFPGWVKFGTYFSENNTWWPFFKLWSAYKARLSAVMQNSDMQADIALLHPLEDMWSVLGQQRDPFPENEFPQYAHTVWEAIHQSGNGCDLVSENIIQQAKVKNGQMVFGSRSYKTLMLLEVESMNPETAEALARFVAQGGRVICIGKVPHQSIGLKDAAAKDAKVKTAIDRIRGSERFIVVDSPKTSANVLDWYTGVQKKYDITPYVTIDKPNRLFSQNYYRQADKDIFYIINSNISEAVDMNLRFRDELKGKQAWLWDAESGERYMIPDFDGSLKLRFSPAESKLLVFDNERGGKTMPGTFSAADTISVKNVWNVKATHVDKSSNSFQMERLADFNEMPFPWLRTFAGTLEYTTTINFENPEKYHTLDAGLTRNGVTELTVNGTPVGAKWYGDRVFDVSGKLVKGENLITVRVTTLLGNYVKSLKDNPTAQRWGWHPARPMGLAGPVALY